jgi:hypothetical protein
MRISKQRKIKSKQQTYRSLFIQLAAASSMSGLLFDPEDGHSTFL